MTKSEFKSLLGLFAVTLALVLIYSFNQNQDILDENAYSASNVENVAKANEVNEEVGPNMASGNEGKEEKTGIVNVGLLPQEMSVNFADYELSVAK